MAKRTRKAKPTKPVLSATQLRAEESVGEDVRKHAEYKLEAHGVHDTEGGVMDGHHLRRLACARGLEAFVKANAKRKTVLITEPMLRAASSYQADVEASHGSSSHEIKVFVDRSSGGVELVSQQRIDAAKRISQINSRMSPTLRVIVDAVVINNPDKMFTEVFAPLTRRKLDSVRDKLLDGLAWLAVEYGHSSNFERDVQHWLKTGEVRP